MWRKLLLVIAVLLVGCTLGDEQVLNETMQDLISDENVEPDNKQALNPTSQTVVETQPSNSLPNLGPAPQWTNQVWLNTDQPLLLADLNGKVVLLEMWTFD